MMGAIHSSEQENNLELYLNDVYEKECEFKIEKEEVEFIKTGIETLVQDLVDQILSHDSFDKLISEYFDEHSFLTEKVCNEKSLVEVYLPIQSDCFFQRYVAEYTSCVKLAKSSIIKVGSFYDGTKNNFPDEFDFIFPRKFLPGFSFHVEYHVQEAIKVLGKSLHYTSSSEKHHVTRKLDFEKVKGIHGPACKMQFIYSNEFGEQRPIHVDLVQAVKIIDSNTQQQFEEMVSKDVKPKTFRKEILSAKSCLYVNKGLAFTEIEQHFMKNILSKKHVKVYRILKYLLNGNGDEEQLEGYLKKRFTDYYTSYHMKILMIHHHEVCANTDIEDLGPCVLQVLKEMSTYETVDRFPRFTSIYTHRVFCVLPYLKSTITTLQSMQRSEDCYNYERHKINSVSKQYLDSITLLGKIRQHCVIL